MTEIYEQEKNSRKKFLIPLIVLLLCGVAFTGAAYAYTSQVDVNNNVIQNEAIYLNLLKNDSNEIVGAVDGDYSITVDWTSTTKTAYNNVDPKAELADDFEVVVSESYSEATPYKFSQTTWSFEEGQKTYVEIPLYVKTNVDLEDLTSTIDISIVFDDEADLEHVVFIKPADADEDFDLDSVTLRGDEFSLTTDDIEFDEDKLEGSVILILALVSVTTDTNPTETAATATFSVSAEYKSSN